MTTNRTRLIRVLLALLCAAWLAPVAQAQVAFRAASQASSSAGQPAPVFQASGTAVAVIPAETNYVLNPLHPGFARIEIGEPREFVTDLRLIT